MNRKMICLFILLFSLLSCNKDDATSDSGDSQLWLKVDHSVPDFTMTLKCTDARNNENIYLITYADNTLSPDLKSVEVGSNGAYDTWIQVYKAFGRTDEITLQLSNSKVCKTKGFEFKEKRVIEVVSSSTGLVNVVDRDISIIEKTIWVD
jgi:hypothetical protein